MYNSETSTTISKKSSADLSLFSEDGASPSAERKEVETLPAAKLKKALSLAGLQVDDDLLEKMHELFGAPDVKSRGCVDR